MNWLSAFWKKAYIIDNPAGAMNAFIDAVADTLEVPERQPAKTLQEDLERYDEACEAELHFPEGMMPGELVTSQPTDAQHDREYYITNPAYWAQPKRDGHKAVVFATSEYVWVQSRSLKLRTDMPVPMKQAFQEVAKSLGAFIIEGEMFHLDWAGNEHMTAAAQAANEAAIAGVSPRTMFAPFGCLYLDNNMFGGHIMTFKRQQVAAAEVICRKAYELGFRMIDVMPTYRTEEEKRQLVAKQQADGREGEIWFMPNMLMRPGKITSRKDPFFDGYVRTKYRVDPLEVVVTDVLPSRAAGHFIGGIDVAIANKEGPNFSDCHPDDMLSIGRIGTGYTRADQQEILERWNEAQSLGKVMKIKITSQGFTQYGKVRHGSFAGFVEEQ